MTDEKNEETTAADPAPEAPSESSDAQPRATQSGPTFNDSPDPLAGVKKAADDAWKQTEGKTVSMRVYIGSIAAVIILMMLARCGG